MKIGLFFNPKNFRALEPLVDFKFNFKIYNGVLKAFKKLFLYIEFVCFYVYKKIKSITLFPYTALNIFMWHDGKGTLWKFLLPQRKFSYNSHENLKKPFCLHVQNMFSYFLQENFRCENGKKFVSFISHVPTNEICFYSALNFIHGNVQSWHSFLDLKKEKKGKFPFLNKKKKENF